MITVRFTIFRWKIESKMILRSCRKTMASHFINFIINYKSLYIFFCYFCSVNINTSPNRSAAGNRKKLFGRTAYRLHAEKSNYICNDYRSTHTVGVPKYFNTICFVSSEQILRVRRAVIHFRIQLLLFERLRAKIKTRLKK